MNKLLKLRKAKIKVEHELKEVIGGDCCTVLINVSESFEYVIVLFDGDSKESSLHLIVVGKECFTDAAFHDSEHKEIVEKVNKGLSK